MSDNHYRIIPVELMNDSNPYEIKLIKNENHTENVKNLKSTNENFII